MRRFFLLTAAVGVAVPLVAGCGVAAAADDVAVATRVATLFAIPRYQALADAAKAQAAAWAGFCAAPSPPAFEGLRARFGETADAWASVQVIRHGPIAEDDRYERMEHWPERKNAIGKGLASLLSGTGTDDLDGARFQQTSVAVQGLSALERLLYDGVDPASAVSARTPAGLRRCAVGTAMATAIVSVADDTLAGWRGTMLASLEKPDEAKEAVTRIATDLLSIYQAIDEAKLKPVMGDSAEDAKPTAAEFWRSGRSARTIALNLASARDLTKIMIEGAEGADTAAETADEAASIAGSMPADVGPSAQDAQARRRLLLLATAVRSARQTASMVLPAALGITLGFNSLDGD
jgi:hypothetical protein